MILTSEGSKTSKTNFLPFIILLVVGFLAFYSVDGIFPSELNSLSLKNGQGYTMITPEPQNPEGALQLDPIKFKGCSTTAAVNFLVDRSGSMAEGQKLSLLQQGILSFANKLSGQSIMGLQTFAQDWTNDINPGLFSNVKSQITNTVCTVNPNGATYTKDAFEKTKSVLISAKASYPSYKFALIFISDGVPETIESDIACIPGQCRANSCTCFAPEQDPTAVANEVKAMGIKIYTIAYVDKADQNINDKLQALMKRVASPNEYYMAPDETKILEILNKISSEICQE